MYVGHYKAPIAIIRRGEIPDYLDAEFWSMHKIWYNSKLTGQPVMLKGWAEWPYYLTEIITTFEKEFRAMKPYMNGGV